jgi:phospholipase C
MKKSVPMHPHRPAPIRLIFSAALACLAGCASSSAHASTPGGPAQPLPHLDHILIVIEENHSYDEIIGSSSASYINSLAQSGALFTDSHAVTHPSQPNYLALFAGSTLGVSSDDCPQSLNAPDLGGELIAQGMSFVGYSESLPAAGFTGCGSGGSFFDTLYARKHNPWVDFADVPAASNQPLSAFPSDYSQLPTVGFVIPNQQDDMHSGSIQTGDQWLQNALSGYIAWATAHNSLLILTWDEDDGSTDNHIPTLFVGAHVKAGKYAETIGHYDVLRTVEALEGLPYTGNAMQATTIADVWQA